MTALRAEASGIPASPACLPRCVAMTAAASQNMAPKQATEPLTGARKAPGPERRVEAVPAAINRPKKREK